jgi:hypothetical protein
MRVLLSAFCRREPREREAGRRGGQDMRSRTRATGLLHGAAAILLASVCAVPAAADMAAPRTKLSVLLTIVPELSDASRRVLLEEVEDIWGPAGVDVEWLSGSSNVPVQAAPLRLLVIQRTPTAHSPHASLWPVGELLPFQSGRAVAVVSISAAKRIVDGANRPEHDLPGIADERIGRVLGRAAAHEIGHFLLRTKTHSGQGLMRAQFGAHEFLDARDEIFALDGEASRWLQQRRAPGVVAAPMPGGLDSAPPPEGFAYRR